MALFLYPGMNINDFYAAAAIKKMEQASIEAAAKSLFGPGSSLNHSEYRNGSDWFIPVGGTGKPFTFTGCAPELYIQAYLSCPPLSAIILRKGLAYSNGANWIVEDDGKDTDKVSNSKPAKAIRKLLRRPNPMQTRREFEALMYVYIEIFGYCPVYTSKPVGFPNHEATDIWILPPNHTCLEFKQGGYLSSGNGYGLKTATVNIDGDLVTLNPDHVYIFRDMNPSFGHSYLPGSKIPTLEDPINNIIDAYESRGVLIRNRGAQGILVNRTQDSAGFIQLDPEEKADVEARFRTMYGRMRNQSPIIITSSNLEWQSMILPTKDLMLFEEIEDSANRICDAYGFPKPLFSSMSKGTTFSNMQTAERNLYQDAIIPEAEMFYEQWNDYFETHKYGIIIQKDYSTLSVLQPDAKAEAESLLRRNQALQLEFRNNGIKLNEWRIANNRDPLPSEMGDKFYSDIKDLLDADGVNIENDQVEDNLNPRSPDNQGLPDQQA